MRSSRSCWYMPNLLQLHSSKKEGVKQSLILKLNETNHKKRPHNTMGQAPEKIDLSPFESWDLFQNDQHKL